MNDKPKLDFIEKNESKGGNEKKPSLMSLNKIVKQFDQFNILAPDHISANYRCMLMYNGGVYSEKGTYRKLTTLIMDGLDYMLSEHKLEEILKLISKRNLYDVTNFDEDKHILNCANGYLNMHTLKLSPHTPKYKSVIQIPVNYVPKSTCPKIEMFLGEVVGAEYVDTMYEIIGFCLVKDMMLEHLFMLIGSGSNGKSIYLQLIEELLGSHNVSKKSLEVLDSNQYATAYLKDKLANIGGDIKDTPVESSVFKQLTSREEVSAQVKYGKDIDYSPSCKLIFSANTPPPFKDHTNGNWRRWVYIKFPHTFPADPNYISTLTTKEELEGLLIKSLEGLYRLYANKQFTGHVSPEVNAELYLNERDSLYNWLEYCIEFGGVASHSVSVNQLHKHYMDYCEDAGIVTGYNIISFGRLIASQFRKKYPGIEKSRSKVDGKYVTVYYNINLIKGE